MGLLDQVLGSVTGGANARKPSIGNTVAAGVVLALLVKGVRSYQAHQATAAAQPGASPQVGRQDGGGLGGGGLGGGLGGALGGLLGGAGGGLGGLLGSLGGAGALGALVKQLQNKGYGQQVNSWVGTGDNQPIAPHELEDALGHDTVQELQQQTGMPKDALLTDLSRTLPQAVHELTPQGREPDDDELHRIAGQG
jgi:uncharacterized protein YidB (DUF937 family)